MALKKTKIQHQNTHCSQACMEHSPGNLRKLKSYQVSFLTIMDETKSQEQEGNDKIHKSTNTLSNTLLNITGSKKKSKEESASILRQVRMKTQHTET